jgi:DNA adenine methylase
MSVAYSPLRYPGGKSCIFPFVSSLIQENGIVGCKYIEPYAGGAGLALRLLYEEYAESIEINDLDPLVYSFWKACKFETDRLIDWIDKVSVTVATWKKCKELIRSQRCYNSFDLATAFFFLNRTNVSGVLSGGVIGGLAQQGNYKINARFNKAELIKKIEKIGRFSSRIEVSNKDGINFIDKYKRQIGNTFIYLDPPYYEKASNLYLNSYNIDDHAKLSKQVAKLFTPWLLSYDYANFITNLYLPFRKCAYRLQHSTSNTIGDEILIFHNELKFKNSLGHLNGVVEV